MTTARQRVPGDGVRGNGSQFKNRNASVARMASPRYERRSTCSYNSCSQWC